MGIGILIVVLLLVVLYHILAPQALHSTEDLQKATPKKTKPVKKMLSAAKYPLVYIPAASWSDPVLPVERPNITKGKSEKYFLRYLKHFFPGKISTDLALPIRDDLYYPDFIYYDPAYHLCIDIEIDEPYALPKGEATHCLGDDHTRNEFFLENGWVVVRFTEEQIVRQPIQCCKFLAEQIAQLLENQQLKEPFIKTPSLTILPTQWTNQQAAQMWATKYRDSYLELIKN